MSKLDSNKLQKIRDAMNVALAAVAKTDYVAYRCAATH